MEKTFSRNQGLIVGLAVLLFFIAIVCIFIGMFTYNGGGAILVGLFFLFVSIGIAFIFNETQKRKEGWFDKEEYIKEKARIKAREDYKKNLR